ncbi:septum formation protein Maf [candidate division WOR-3 bacterium]|nr:septum formation protein Maf [candidate division WOR-3 bacterium]
MREKIFLASASSRRSFFLSALKAEFSVIIPEVDETPFRGESPLEYVVRMAKEKFSDAAKKAGREDLFIVSADTVVALDEDIFLKPVSREEALSHIRKLSGKWHTVLTALVCGFKDKNTTEVSSTEVCFRELKENEISLYLSSNEWMGKAGAYAVQGLGGFMVDGIKGAVDNVVGFPTSLFLSMAEKHGISFQG